MPFEVYIGEARESRLGTSIWMDGWMDGWRGSTSQPTHDTNPSSGLKLFAAIVKRLG